MRLPHWLSMRNLSLVLMALLAVRALLYVFFQF